MYIEVIFAILVLLAILWYQMRRRDMSLFKRLNIPGPEPHLITGNLREYNEKGPAECQVQWTKKYGKILGYYLGAKPTLLVSDPELLKLVLVKNFQDFEGRTVFPEDGGVPDSRIFHGVSLMSGIRWKEIRNMMSPGFTANKLKQMTQPMIDAAEVLSEIIREKIKNNENLHVTELFGNLTLDIIERTAFGMHTDVQLHSNGMLLQSLKRIIDNHVSNRVFWLILCFPELRWFVTVYRQAVELLRSLLGLSSILYLINNFKEVIKRRSVEKIPRPDLLQVLINASKSANQLKIPEKQFPSDSANNSKATTKENKIPAKPDLMTDDEVIANAMVLLIAGEDTTALTLSIVLHVLTMFPEVQEKLRDEINGVLDEEELDYSAITKMTYMHQVISETLRIYPTVLTFVMRDVGKLFTYKNFTLPKGLPIQSAVWQLHRDPDFWENPNEFDPDRFSPSRKNEINTYAYQPFGTGPRNCLGLRFAYTIMKIVLAKLLHKFKFVTEEKFRKEYLKFTFQLFLIKPLNNGKIYAIEI